MNPKLYLRGIPTDLDVKKLQETFSNLENGVDITFEQIEQLIGNHKETTRFKTVVNQWRKVEERQGRYVASRRSIGYYFADNADTVNAAASGFNTGVRYIKKAVTRVKLVTREVLSEAQKCVYDKLITIGSSIEGINRINSHRSSLPSLIS